MNKVVCNLYMWHISWNSQSGHTSFMYLTRLNQDEFQWIGGWRKRQWQGFYLSTLSSGEINAFRRKTTVIWQFTLPSIYAPFIFMDLTRLNRKEFQGVGDWNKYQLLGSHLSRSMAKNLAGVDGYWRGDGVLCHEGNARADHQDIETTPYPVSL